MKAACAIALATADFVIAVCKVWVWQVYTLLEDYAEMRLQSRHNTIFGYIPADLETFNLLRPRGLSVELILKLPTFRVRESGRISHGLLDGRGLEDECAVCLDGYLKDDVIRLLPSCEHYFHKDCVDKWLEGRSICPLCRTEVTNGSKDKLSKDGTVSMSVSAGTQLLRRAVAISRS